MRAALIAASRPAPVAVVLPDGSTYHVRTLTAFDSQRTQAVLEANKDAADGMTTGRVLAMVLCDASGELLFDVNSLADVLALSTMSPEFMRAIFAAHNKANGASPAEAEAAGN